MSETNGAATVRRKADVAGATTKPPRVEVRVDGIPAELRERPQWVCWNWIWNAGKKKWDKPPLNPQHLRNASTTDNATWSMFAAVLSQHRAGKANGIGYVFAAADPFAGVDLDDCRDLETGLIDPRAVKIIKELDSYCEILASGNGVKIVVRAQLPSGSRRKGDI
jgi:primase-polymerase (primpol)-like protein